jgi:hypothetical protein
VSGRSQFHDSNLTTLTSKLFDLVDGQQQYSLPTDLLKLHAIEIKDASGNWIKLKELDQNDLTRTITDYEDTPGTPHSYDIRGVDIYLYPAPATGSVTLSGGGKVHGSFELDAFTAADTAQEPGFAEPFHRILSIGAACDWFLLNDSMDKYDRWIAQYEMLRKQCREYYATRNPDRPSRINPEHSTRNYL